MRVLLCCFVWAGYKSPCPDADPASVMNAASPVTTLGLGGVASPDTCSVSAPGIRPGAMITMNTYHPDRKGTLTLAFTLEDAAEWSPVLISPCVRGTALKFMSIPSRKGRKCLRVTRTFCCLLKAPGSIQLTQDKRACLSWVWTHWTETSCHHSMCTVLEQRSPAFRYGMEAKTTSSLTCTLAPGQTTQKTWALTLALPC